MAYVVLVHGIAHEQLTPDGVEAEWLPALAGTVRLAGRQDLADRIWPPRSRTDAIDVRMGFYGDLFSPTDQQGAANGLADLSTEQARLAEAFGREWLTRIAGRARAGTPDAEQAQLALNLIRDPSQSQGVPNVLREIIRGCPGTDGSPRSACAWRNALSCAPSSRSPDIWTMKNSAATTIAPIPVNRDPRRSATCCWNSSNTTRSPAPGT